MLDLPLGWPSDELKPVGDRQSKCQSLAEVRIQLGRTRSHTLTDVRVRKEANAAKRFDEIIACGCCGFVVSTAHECACSPVA
jgi:hypothetical protein